MKKFFNSDMRSKNTIYTSTPQKILGKVLFGCAESKTQRKLERFLSRWASEVCHVEDGRACIEQALFALKQDNPFDLILVDTDLPVLDAYSITHFLRENDYPASIVSFSQDYMPLYDLQSEEAGCDGHILKSNIDTLPGFFGWERAAAANS